MSAMDERTDISSRTRAGLARLAGPWWMFLLTGVAWLILAWIALRFNPASIPTVGVLLGVYFLVATINEFVIASVMPSWRWLHILMGIIFAFGAGWSFARPYNAFWALASILGLLLIFGHARHHHLRQYQGGQQRLVAWHGGRHPGGLARFLGLPAVPPGPGSHRSDAPARCAIVRRTTC